VVLIGLASSTFVRFHRIGERRPGWLHLSEADSLIHRMDNGLVWITMSLSIMPRRADNPKSSTPWAAATPKAASKLSCGESEKVGQRQADLIGDGRAAPAPIGLNGGGHRRKKSSSDFGFPPGVRRRLCVRHLTFPARKRPPLGEGLRCYCFVVVVLLVVVLPLAGLVSDLLCVSELPAAPSL
jgi:hypothetical protein